MNYLKKEFRPTNSTGDSTYGLTKTDAVVVAVTGGVSFLAAWGISQWLGSSEPEPRRHEKTMLISSSSSSSSSRGVGDQNRNEYNNITQGQANWEGKKIVGGKAKWTRPKKGCFKLNTDASVQLLYRDKTGPASAGGVIRNDAGQWIVGFTSTLGVCDITEAELEAVKEGLGLALERGYYRVEVETDSEAAVKWINEHYVKDGHYLKKVVEDCRELLKRLGSKVSHVSRDRNECADALADIEIPSDELLVVWEDEPNCKRVLNVVANDMKQSLSAPYVLG